MKFPKNSNSIEITGLQRSSYKDFSKTSRNQNKFLSHMIKDGQYLSQKIHQRSIVTEIKLLHVKENKNVLFSVVYTGSFSR